MLMYGPPQSTNLTFSGKGVVYNLTSMKEGFVRLAALIPPNEFGRFTDRDFDILYADYIMGNDIIFCECAAMISCELLAVFNIPISNIGSTLPESQLLI